MDESETPLMEFWAGGDGDLAIRYPQEQFVDGGEAIVWLARSDAEKVLSFIRLRQKATKESLIFAPLTTTIVYGTRPDRDGGESKGPPDQ